MTAPAPAQRRLPFVVVGLLVALVLAGFVSQYASSDPDGLTKVAQDQGFAQAERESATADSPLAGYGTAGIESTRLSGGLAGVAGVVATFLLAGGLLRLVRRPQRASPPQDPPPPRDAAGGLLSGSASTPSGESA